MQRIVKIKLGNNAGKSTNKCLITTTTIIIAFWCVYIVNVILVIMSGIDNLLTS